MSGVIRLRLTLVLAACVTFAGCSDRSGPRKEVAASSSARPASSQRPVDDATVAFLSKARAAHHNADLAESKDDVAGAISHIEKITLGPKPPLGPEVKEVLADALARSAELKSRTGRFADAASDVEAGLGYAAEVSYFRGHLYEILGVVEERRMKALEQKGDSAGALVAKEKALAAFERAVSIQDEVIERALKDAPKPTGSAPASSASP